MMKRFLSILLVLSALTVPAFAAKTVFIDGNAATKTPGTKVTAAYLNAVNNHRHDGTATDGSGALDYAVDTGAANAIVASVPKALPALVVGLPIEVKVAATNSGAATLNLNSLGVLPIHKLGGQNLAGGDIQANQIIQVAYDGTAWQLLSYNSPPVTDATTLQSQTAAMLTPPGAVMAFAMPTVPGGWLECKGQAVLRSAYPALYTAIGTTWGSGDNVSTFNLPDLRGEFLRGWDDGRGVDSDRPFGDFQADAFKTHTHPGGGYGYTNGDSGVAGTGVGTGRQTTWTTDASGDSETRPRNQTVLYCIKY